MKIISPVVNNPTFIELQYKSMQKFVKGAYEFIIFNDAKNYPDLTNGGNINIRYEIEKTCKKLNIKCINVPNNHHRFFKDDASLKHSDTMNFILKYQIDNPDKYLIIDSDMFLVNYLDVNKYCNYDCAIFMCGRKELYIWPNLFYFDTTRMKKMDMIDWREIPGYDSGGMTKDWLKEQNRDNIYFINYLASSTHTNRFDRKDTGYCCVKYWNKTTIPSWFCKDYIINFLENDVRNTNGNYFCEIYDDTFFHYRAGSNWRREGMEFHQRLTKLLDIALSKFYSEN